MHCLHNSSRHLTPQRKHLTILTQNTDNRRAEKAARLVVVVEEELRLPYSKHNQIKKRKEIPLVGFLIYIKIEAFSLACAICCFCKTKMHHS